MSSRPSRSPWSPGGWGRAPGDGGGQPGRPAGAATAPAAVVDAPAPRALVHVAGEVRRPGVYRVGAGARAIEAIRRAGGPTRRADLSGLNLAAPLQDGQQVLIPSRAARGAGGAGGGAGAAESAGPISLSSATAQDLEALDGIGPTLAARIVEWRRAHGGFASDRGPPRRAGHRAGPPRGAAGAGDPVTPGRGARPR